MKTVFNNSQLCHVWSEQKQPHGKGSNLFFEGDSIYSYGRHYLAAKIYTNKKGKKLVLVNGDGYSISTAKHLSYIRSALSGKLDFLEVANPGNFTGKLDGLNKKYLSALENAEKKRSVKSDYHLDCILNSIEYSLKNINLYRSFLGLKPVKGDSRRLSDIKKSLKEKLKRYTSENTPEKLAAKAVARQKKEAENQAKVIADFREGKPVNVMLPFDLLRIEKEEVVTSRGARVPLDQAKNALNKFLASQTIDGESIGNFRVDHVTQSEAVTVFKIGCHNITLEEALSVLK